MPATIHVMPVADRESRIEQAGTTGRTTAVRFRGPLVDLPIKRIDLDVPIYRMANIRTTVRQREHIASHGFADDYFGNGQENQSVQQEQHGILVDLSKDSKADIYHELSARAEQSEALIITSKGVVLNGNRRLAAMRDLVATNPGQFARFSHVDVAILPSDANEDDLTALETILQIAPQLRLEYDWVDRILGGLRRQVEVLGWDLARAAQYWNESEKSLRARLNTLTTAEQYLDYVGQSGHYGVVSDDEQAFTTFQERQASRATADPSRLEAERFVFFGVLASKATLGRRVYEFAVQIAPITDIVLKSVDPVAPLDAVTASDNDDPLMAVAVGPDRVRNGILTYLRDRSNAGAVAAWAGAARDAIDHARRATKKGQEYVRNAQAANAAAAVMSLANADSATIQPAANQMIQAIALLADQLELALRNYPRIKGTVDKQRLSSACDKLAGVLKSIDRP